MGGNVFQTGTEEKFESKNDSVAIENALAAQEFQQLCAPSLADKRALLGKGDQKDRRGLACLCRA
jgi:hypothetical protein